MPGILKHLHHSYKIANKEYFLDVKYFSAEYKNIFYCTTASVSELHFSICLLSEV